MRCLSSKNWHIKRFFYCLQTLISNRIMSPVLVKCVVPTKQDQRNQSAFKAISNPAINSVNKQTLGKKGNYSLPFLFHVRINSHKKWFRCKMLRSFDLFLVKPAQWTDVLCYLAYRANRSENKYQQIMLNHIVNVPYPINTHTLKQHSQTYLDYAL